MVESPIPSPWSDSTSVDHKGKKTFQMGLPSFNCNWESFSPVVDVAVSLFFRWNHLKVSTSSSLLTELITGWRFSNGGDCLPFGSAVWGLPTSCVGPLCTLHTGCYAPVFLSVCGGDSSSSLPCFWMNIVHFGLSLTDAGVYSSRWAMTFQDVVLWYPHIQNSDI
jgi:hypothetical protein